jgi:hypothetical protein
MIIKKFNEDLNTYDSGIHAIVNIPVNKIDIKYDDLLKNNYYNTYKIDYADYDTKSLIQYTIEHYLFEQGLLKFSYKLVDESGSEVKIEDLEKRIELNNTTNKFNI